ncbi:MAG: TetR/AcrR family transcriptional regulator [Sedimentisphaerales bacterium]|nr:TetR/AcrR family transcriptional regulator [Sedimentisphaerales bacterium]
MADSDKTDEVLNQSVQERLLNAAEDIFCEKGFEGTSIRDIAASAGCNIASVNYYFGGKQQLYEQVWKRHLIPMKDSRLQSIEKILLQNTKKHTLEDLIKSFAESFIGSIVDSQKVSNLNKLMAREYINKHLPANMFLEEVMMPTVTAMQKALIEAFPDINEEKIPFIVFSLIGQLVHVVHVRAMFENGIDDLTRKLFDSDEVINHIVKFTCAGIRTYIKENK